MTDDTRLKVAPRGVVTPARAGRRRFRRVAIVAAGIAVVAVAALGITRWRRGSTSIVRAESDGQRNDPLPYVNYVPVAKEDREKSGTTVYNRERAERGYSLYAPHPDSTAFLVDMQSEVVHQWSSRVGQPEQSRVPASYRGWQLVRMTPKGELFAVVNRGTLLKLDWNSEVMWKVSIGIHHDMVIGEEGELYAITEVPRLVESSGQKRLIADHGVSFLGPDGSIRRRISFYDVFMKNDELRPMLEWALSRRFAHLEKVGLDDLLAEKNRPKDEEDDDEGSTAATWAAHMLSDPQELARLKAYMSGAEPIPDTYESRLLIRTVPNFPADIFHLNTVLLLNAHPGGLWKKGDILVSFRAFNLIAVLDPVEERIKWWWGPGEVWGQHEPSMLANGNIIMFDNGSSGAPRRQNEPEAAHRKYSKIVEVDPTTKKIVWEYEGQPRRKFYSPAEGGCQMLPGGNIYVTQAESGRAFQLTRDREIVWEFFNPKFDSSGKRRSGMYRMEWIAPSVVEPLLTRR